MVTPEDCDMLSPDGGGRGVEETGGVGAGDFEKNEKRVFWEEPTTALGRDIQGQSFPADGRSATVFSRLKWARIALLTCYRLRGIGPLGSLAMMRLDATVDE